MAHSLDLCLAVMILLPSFAGFLDRQWLSSPLIARGVVMEGRHAVDVPDSRFLCSCTLTFSFAPVRCQGGSGGGRACGQRWDTFLPRWSDTYRVSTAGREAVGSLPSS